MVTNVSHFGESRFPTCTGRWLFLHGKYPDIISQLECDGTRTETRYRLSVKRTSPFKSAGVSVQSTTSSRGVHVSGSNAGYNMFRGSVKSTGYPLHSPVSPSLPLPCATVCHHISAGIYLKTNHGLFLLYRFQFIFQNHPITRLRNSYISKCAVKKNIWIESENVLLRYTKRSAISIWGIKEWRQVSINSTSQQLPAADKRHVSALESRSGNWTPKFQSVITYFPDWPVSFGCPNTHFL